MDKRGLIVSLTPQERISLACRINNLRFAEYHGVGWLKATSFWDPRRYVHGSEDRQLLDDYLANPRADAELQLRLIRPFLNEWVASHVPESSGAWGEGDFQPAGRAEALALADQIIEVSLDDPDGDIRRTPPWWDDPTPEDEAAIPYSQLRSWFADDLFDLSALAYFIDNHPNYPGIIAMDRDIIGMLWLE